MKKKSSDVMSKAILLTLILIVIDLIGGFAHLRFEGWFRWISTIVMAIAIIVFCIQFGKQQVEGVTYGKVFGYGFKIALLVSVFVVVYSLISINFIFPEYIDQVLLKTRTDLQAKGGMSDEQIDQAVSMTKKFMTPVPMSIFIFLATLFFGTIAALLGAAFAKKSEPNAFQGNP
jgi:Protein of unknown function (DUF4199)